MRIIEPVAGLPRITITLAPDLQLRASDHATLARQQSHHLSRRRHFAIRLTTDAPLSYIEREASFVLTRPLHLVFGPDEPYTGDLATTCREFPDRTRDYWTGMGATALHRLRLAGSDHPRGHHAQAVSNFEETGAIIAAHTTSIPEAPRSGRTWDYRYCWLRDAYFVVKALNRIGATQTMEGLYLLHSRHCSGGDPSARSIAWCRPTRWTR